MNSHFTPYLVNERQRFYEHAFTWRLSTGFRSTNASNINFFLLHTKFLQPVNLATLTIWSLFNPLAVPAPHRLSPSLAHKPYPHWKSQIAHSDQIGGLCITLSMESTSWFIPSALPVMSRLTSSFTCQLISVIITILIICHSFALSLQAQNLPFQQILPTLILLLPMDCLHDHGTGPKLSCLSM